MSIASLVSVLSLLLFISIDCDASIDSCDSGQSVQIIRPANHTFHLEIDNLKKILEADVIRDRTVVVVSVAGAFRKGKSFLINFFVRYLCAQVLKYP